MRRKRLFGLILCLGFILVLLIGIHDALKPQQKPMKNDMADMLGESAWKKREIRLVSEENTSVEQSTVKPTFSMSRNGRPLLDFNRGLEKLETPWSITPAHQEAKRRGAMGKLTFRIIDLNGLPVADADVKGGFYVGDEKGVAFSTRTDMEGLASIEGVCVGDVNVRIEKEGYYRSRFVYWFPQRGYDCVKNGRWLPWNPTIEVELKRIVNPIPMYVKPYEKIIAPPETDNQVGFDFQKGDWVQPYGSGVVTDLLMQYEYRAGDIPPLYYFASVSFVFTNRYDGAYVLKKDEFSSFRSVYHADTNAVYLNSFTFCYDRLSGEKITETKLPESAYLILRTRSKTDKEGSLLSANYAKIYGPISAGRGGIFMVYYFNPNENDPNLEVDTTRNLLPPHRLGFLP